MGIEIRRLRAEDFEEFSAVDDLAFGSPEPAVDRPGHRELFSPDRSFSAVESGGLVGNTCSLALRLSVPNADPVATAGVSCVGVLPTHRRRGILRALMEHQLHDVHERGEPLAALWAAESGIYGRFGFGCATDVAHWTLRREQSRFRSDVETGGGLRIAPLPDAVETLARVHDALAPDHPGFVSRDPGIWPAIVADTPRERGDASPLTCVLHERDGRTDGYVLFRRRHNEDTPVVDGTLTVVELLGQDAVATAALWRFCFDADLMIRTEARERPLEDPVRLFLSDPRWLETITHDGLYVRLVDVASALTARGWLQRDRLTFEVHDPLLAHNTGRWRLDAGPEGATCERTEDEPDLSVDVADVGAAYLGRPLFADLAWAGRVREHTSGAARRADVMFRGERAPWCPTDF